MAKVISINRTPGDYIRATRHLTLEERGAYQDILDQIVELGQDEDPPSLPDDDRSIAGILGVSVQKWRQIKQRLCEGPLRVLIVGGGRISQTRIVKEIEAARRRIDAGVTGGKASGETRRSRRNDLRERLARSGANDRSTTVQRPSNDGSTTVERTPERFANGDPNDSRTSHESRVTSNEREPVVPSSQQVLGVADSEAKLVIKNPELPEDGLAAIDIIDRTWSIVAPAADPLDEFAVSKWLQLRHHHPWCIAAAICEAEAHLRGAKKPDGYLRGIIEKREDWPCDTAQDFVTYSLDPARRAKLSLVVGGVA